MKNNNAKKRIKGLGPKYLSLVVGLGCTALYFGAHALELPVMAQDDEPKSSASTGGERRELAQFQLPQTPTVRHPSPDSPADTPNPEKPLIQQLTYQFSYGSESDLTYRRNLDLDRSVRDNYLLAAPQINGSIIYRPSSSIDMMLEMLLEREFAINEERIVNLPGGGTLVAPRRYTSLPVDQAWITFKGLGPLDLTVGRRNFEDDRHWVYDTSVDALILKFKQGAWQTEASVSRKDRLDLDLLGPVKKTRTDNYMLYVDYRGIDDIRLAGYAIFREDKTGAEGRPLHFGLRANGTPSNQLNYWSELSILRGRDELKKRFRGHAVDVGGTYRFTDVPFAPSITLGYAYGSGDDNPNDAKNHEFRQTGLHSNEARLGGIPKIKYYGEALDPDLSNLQILTVGVGVRPAPTVTLDLVYHHYRLNKNAEELRNAAVTAQMNQDDTQVNKRVGCALDIVLGFRNLFGLRRLGMDVRTGLFFPGNAYRNENSAGIFRKADKSISVVVKFWY